MSSQIEFSEQILRQFLAEKDQGLSPGVDRKEIVAHATLSALAHHWPSRCTEELRELLGATVEIKEIEHSRWAVQRRIAIAKLSASFTP